MVVHSRAQHSQGPQNEELTLPASPSPPTLLLGAGGQPRAGSGRSKRRGYMGVRELQLLLTAAQFWEGNFLSCCLGLEPHTALRSAAPAFQAEAKSLTIGCCIFMALENLLCSPSKACFPWGAQNPAGRLETGGRGREPALESSSPDSQVLCGQLGRARIQAHLGSPYHAVRPCPTGADGDRARLPSVPLVRPHRDPHSGGPALALPLCLEIPNHF